MRLALFTQGGLLSGILPMGIISAGSAKDIAVNIGGIQIVRSELHENTGDISYFCWMGMIYGQIHVKE